MAKRLLIRDGENISADMLQRIIGLNPDLLKLTQIAGIGTGYSIGAVGSVLSTSTGHLAVTASGSDRILTIAGGWARVVRDSGSSSDDPRALFLENDANDTVTIGANSQGTSRTDTVCAKIDMATAPTSDGSNLVTFVAIQGGASNALGNAPADGNLYLPLANVVVANGATTLAQGVVTDLRQVRSPLGTLTYDQITSNLAATSGTTEKTVLTATSVTIGSGRRIKITARFGSIGGSVVGDEFEFRIKEGSTVFNKTTFVYSTGSNDAGSSVEAIIQPAAGAHTYIATFIRTVGTGTAQGKASATQPAFILVEDIGV